MKHFFIFFISVFLFTITYNLFGQSTSDSIVYEDLIDTVRVKKKVFINKTIYILPDKTTSLYYISGNIGIYGVKNYSSICPECKEYFHKVEKATKSSLSYILGLNFVYSPKKFLLSVGASISSSRAKFNYTNASNNKFKNNNRLTYYEATIMLGYWLNKNKSRMSYIVSGGISAASLHKVVGSTINFEDSETIAPLKEELNFSPSVLIVNGSVKLVYALSKRFSPALDIFYRYDLNSLIKTTKQPYTLQRNMLGLKLELFYKLK